MNGTCEWCGEQLHGNRRRFCSDRHKDKYHNRNNPRGKFAYLAERHEVDIYTAAVITHCTDSRYPYIIFYSFAFKFIAFCLYRTGWFFRLYG